MEVSLLSIVMIHKAGWHQPSQEQMRMLISENYLEQIESCGMA